MRIHLVGAQSLDSCTSADAAVVIGVAEAIELGRVQGQVPCRLIVYGIEDRHLDVGTQLSAEVAGALDRVVEQVLEALNSLAKIAGG